MWRSKLWIFGYILSLLGHFKLACLIKIFKVIKGPSEILLEGLKGERMAKVSNIFHKLRINNARGAARYQHLLRSTEDALFRGTKPFSNSTTPARFGGRHRPTHETRDCSQNFWSKTHSNPVKLLTRWSDRRPPKRDRIVSLDKGLIRTLRHLVALVEGGAVRSTPPAATINF